ncbi:FkbM family methyltransferase [Mycolicibacterium vanbaalenii]|uniref:FkbM family methyltransferase n=1 Tax=Mycolicibacterium vanbaalenii TaxID=110539 RepID=UPI001EEE90E0|nr:FkbM family methyltransferase [Mycolicibacterium vanbaalenii]UJL31497.1 FkbM family methyltransferase [Mycolicibacterium vanbaalenii]WND58345.1 FkbM family methyltransferase [Mycolicibacterium vanbaalenii]
MTKILKGVSLLQHHLFINAVVKYRVAASTEHLQAIAASQANSLIDAGANKGQFSLAFRSIRPNAPIVAFEPLPSASATYERVFAHDPYTRLLPYALSDREEQAQFYVTDRTDSSSLLKPGTRQERAFGVRPASRIVVPVKRLEDCINLTDLARPIMLKVDVQGGELRLFEGFDSLEQVDFVYAELSFCELYEGQPLFEEVAEYLASRGFTIAGAYNQVTTSEYGPTQVDILFKRRTGVPQEGKVQNP